MKRKQLQPGDRVELRESAEPTDGIVEWVSDDGQRARVRWDARRDLTDQQTTEIAGDLRKVA